MFSELGANIKGMCQITGACHSGLEKKKKKKRTGPTSLPSLSIKSINGHHRADECVHTNGQWYNYFFVWRGVQRKKNEATITLIGNSICFELRTDWMWVKSAKECCGNCNIDTEWGFISLSGDPINHLWVGVNWISSTIGQFSCSPWVSEWVVDWGDPIPGTNLGHNKWGSLTVDWLYLTIIMTGRPAGELWQVGGSIISRWRNGMPA